jgi:PilZ domain
MEAVTYAWMIPSQGMIMLDQMASAVNTLPPQGGNLECRVYRRLNCELPGFCKPASELGSEEPRWSATARDISQGGIRLQISRRYEPGATLAIELPAKVGQENCVFFAKVIHVRPEQAGLWMHGCQFISPLSQDELKRLLGTDQRDGFFPEDQPQAVPVSSFTVGQTVPTPMAADTRAEKSNVFQVRFQLVTFQGTLANCLIKRLSVPKSWPLAAGKKVTIRGGDPTAWALRVQVIQCARHEDRWTLQCRLMQGPGTADVLQFLSRRTTTA